MKQREESTVNTNLDIIAIIEYYQAFPQQSSNYTNLDLRKAIYSFIQGCHQKMSKNKVSPQDFPISPLYHIQVF